MLNLTEESFSNLLTAADKVVRGTSTQNYAASLVTATKVNYKDLYNKLDFDLFLDAIEYLALEDFKNGNQKSLVVFKVTNQFKQYATQQRLIKEILMFNYLTTLWEALQE